MIESPLTLTLSLYISLALHPFQLFITNSRSSKLCSVSTQCWCIWVLVDRLALMCPCVVVLYRASLMNLFLLLHLSSIPSMSCSSNFDGSWDGRQVVAQLLFFWGGYCFRLLKTARGILVNFSSSFRSKNLVWVQEVQPYSSTLEPLYLSIYLSIYHCCWCVYLLIVNVT